MHSFVSKHRRFSDVAPGLAIDSGEVYLHDIYGASLKMLNSINSGVKFEDVDKIVGMRNKGNFEQTLPEDVKQTLIDFISEAIDKIGKIRLMVNKTFKINSEVIWLSVMENAEQSEMNKAIKKLNSISPNDFSRIIIYVREKLENEKRKIELSY